MNNTITDEMIIEACQQCSSMSEAIKELGMNHNTFRKRAKSLGCYKPNQGRKGKYKQNIKEHTKESVSELFLSNKVPINSVVLKKYLFRFGFKTEECEICHQGPEWNGKKLILQLDHKDGNHHNNSLENLQIVCPNCHSQTSTFCANNRIKSNKKNKCCKCGKEIKYGEMCVSCAHLPNRKLTDEQVEYVIKSANDKSNIALSIELNVSEMTIRKILKNGGYIKRA